MKLARDRATLRLPILLALAVAAVLSIQLVPQSAFHGDNYLQIGVVEKVTEGTDGSPLDLYGFMDGSPGSVRKSIESGPIPWFVHRRFRFDFFQPVS